MHRLEKDVCQSNVFKMKKNSKKQNNNNVSSLTHCNDGRFHKWEIIDNKLQCSLCQKEYEKIKTNETSSDKDTKEIISNIRFNLLKNLTKKYCISGEKHDIDKKTNLCKKCKINPEKYKYKSSELKDLDKNIRRMKADEDLKYSNYG